MVQTISPLDRALGQRGDYLALEQYEDDKGRYQDQHRACTEQGNIGGVVALKSAQRTGHRPLRWILDEHERK